MRSLSSSSTATATTTGGISTTILYLCICTIYPILTLQAIKIIPTTNAYHENERIIEYQKRNYTWPIPDTQLKPNTPGWRSIWDKRYAQISSIPNTSDRYFAFLESMYSTVLQQNFTEHGWGLTRAPDDLVQELKEALYNGMGGREATKLHTLGNEPGATIIETKDDDSRVKFIPNDKLNRKVADSMKSMHEDWINHSYNHDGHDHDDDNAHEKINLVSYGAFGLRVYQNDSKLLMHTDRAETHIISSILHIDHSDDSEPWPLVIEDYQGNTNEVVLESGDLLFYESSKCYHGRPKAFNGSWYSSIFTHYYPEGHDTSVTNEQEKHFAVPLHWSDHVHNDTLPKLVKLAAGLKEPECEGNWCGLKNSIKWRGPAEEGKIITTGYYDDKNDHSDGHCCSNVSDNNNDDGLDGKDEL